MEMGLFLLALVVCVGFGYLILDMSSMKKHLSDVDEDYVNLMKNIDIRSNNILEHCNKVLNHCELVLGEESKNNALISSTFSMQKDIMDELKNTTEQLHKTSFDVTQVASALSRFEERLNDFDALKYVTPDNVDTLKYVVPDPFKVDCGCTIESKSGEEEAKERLYNFMSKLEESEASANEREEKDI